MKIDLLNKILGKNCYKTKEYSEKMPDIEKTNLNVEHWEQLNLNLRGR